MNRNGEVQRLYASSSCNTAKPKKRRRISRACGFCHRRSIRCELSQEPQRCQNCVDFNVDCTFLRPAKKRGIKGHRRSQVEEESSSGEHANLLLELTNSHFNHRRGNTHESERGRPNLPLSINVAPEQRDMVLANLDKIQDLIPSFPPPDTSTQSCHSRLPLRSSPFAAIMSMCALASARARDGALFPGRWIPSYFQQPSPESFFAAARDALPTDLSAMRGLDWMRTCALLALVGIQAGKIDVMHQYLGLYHSLVAIDGLHDEKNWPKEIGIVEIEERRRLFWSMYTLEVYSSIVWGGIIRCRESQSRVFYPGKVDDDWFSERGFENLLPETRSSRRRSITSTTATNEASWLHGWNFTTELYRILEHAMDDFHRRRPQNIGPFSPSDLFVRDAPPQSVVLEKVMSMHAALPDGFKETRTAVSDMIEDRFSFQAANIAATLQLVRMILFTAEDATVDQKCAIAHELLDGFAKVPVFYLRAISSPLLHHLAGIGSILGSVIEGPLSEASYLQVRTALLAMADLLASLEVGMTRTVGATQRLRSQVERIDEYMATQRQQEFAFNPPASLTNNIDSSLRSNEAGIHQDQQQPQWQAQSTEPYGFIGNQGGISGIAGSGDQFQFQLPPELLKDWPWPFDMTQGFGTF